MSTRQKTRKGAKNRQTKPVSIFDGAKMRLNATKNAEVDLGEMIASEWNSTATSVCDDSNNRSINVAIPNTSKEKMEAIAKLSDAILTLAHALNSVNVQCAVSNNTITGSSGAGIHISTEQ